MPAHGEKRVGWIDDCFAGERRLSRTRGGQHEGATIAARAKRHRQRAANRTQCSAQRKLTGEFIARERAVGNLLCCGEDADRDRQVEATGLLRKVGRGEIPGGLWRWELESGVRQRG